MNSILKSFRFEILFFICIFIAASDVTAQKDVMGVVRSAADSRVLVGATVTVKGSLNSTVTDVKGHYLLKNVSSSDSLFFSYVGFQSESAFVGNRKEINIDLPVEASSLDQVVVIGYGTAKKRDLTGAVTNINMKDIPPAANMNFIQALKGYAAGLNIQGGSSVAGDVPGFSIRGKTSLSASDAPLIVVDGIIFQGSISDINVSDIESLDILKDASAAAVYGSRSANGVILITTKKGKKGKPSINLSGSYGLQDFSNNPVKYMNGKQYADRLADYDYEQFLYLWYAKHPTSADDMGGRPVYPDINDPAVVSRFLKSQDEVKNYLAGHEINWIDEVTRQAPVQNYDLSLSGASDRSNYYISAGYTDQKGILVNDQFKRITLTTKVSTKVTDWITLGLNTMYSSKDPSGLNVTMAYARNASPLASMYDSSGNYPIQFNGDFLQLHPLRNTLVDNNEIDNTLLATGYADIEVPGIKGLTYHFDYSNTSITNESRTFFPKTVYEGDLVNGEGTISNSKEKNWIFNNIVNYSHSFGTDHRVHATLLYSREQRLGNSDLNDATQFSNASLGFNNLSFGSLSTVSSAAYSESSISYMARVNYVYKNRYMVTGTARRDGFSGFGSSNKYATFPSLSFAWTPSEENFMQHAKKWLDFLKIRVSYGANGNQGIGRYSSLSRMGIADYVFGSNQASGIIPTSLGNSSLGWETTKSLNFGIDYSINQRISGSIDLYHAQTSNVLVQRSLPGATGYRNVWTNIGGIANKGIELNLSTINVEGGALRWESRFVFSLNRDKITKLYGDGRDDIGNSWFIGKPISAIYDYKRAGGLWTEEDLFKGQILQDFYPGQFKLVDLNNDGKITPGDDRTIIGYATPNYRFSISNTLSFKNFVLSILINSIQGGNGYYLEDNSYFLEPTHDFDYVIRINQPAIRTFWTPFNGVTNAPGIYNYPKVLSGNYQSRSFMRIQDVSLVYNFQNPFLRRLKLQGLQLYISGQNLYTFTKWEGYDPEVGGTGLPVMRSIVGGFKINL